MMRCVCVALAMALCLAPSALLYLLQPAAPRLVVFAPVWLMLMTCALAWHATWLNPLWRALRYVHKNPQRVGA